MKTYPPGVWVDWMINDWANEGNITPYDPAMVQAASIDLKLSNYVRFPNPAYKPVTEFWREQLGPHNGRKTSPFWARELQSMMDKIGEPLWSEPVEFEVLIMGPGDFVLLSSLERVRIPPTACATLYLKSTPGRMAMNHSHSGWGDPGFGYPEDSDMSSWTFEVSHVGSQINQGFAPVILRPEMSLVQMVLQSTADVPSSYYGQDRESYTGQVLPEPPRDVLRIKPSGRPLPTP